MILLDVNVLIHAYQAGDDASATYRNWLVGVLGGPEPLAVSETVLTGVVRVASNRRVFPNAAPAVEALRFTEAIRRAPGVHTLAPDAAVWAQLETLLQADAGVKGGQVTDAYLAALAMAHGARLATRDRGMARYKGLRFFDPATEN